MKTAISLPDKLGVIADKYAAEHDMSRSALFTAAVTEYIESHKTDGLIQQINDAVTAIGDDTDTTLINKSKSILRGNEW